MRSIHLPRSSWSSRSIDPLSLSLLLSAWPIRALRHKRESELAPEWCITYSVDKPKMQSRGLCYSNGRCGGGWTRERERERESSFQSRKRVHWHAWPTRRVHKRRMYAWARGRSACLPAEGRFEFSRCFRGRWYELFAWERASFFIAWIFSSGSREYIQIYFFCRRGYENSRNMAWRELDVKLWEMDKFFLDFTYKIPRWFIQKNLDGNKWLF